MEIYWTFYDFLRILIEVYFFFATVFRPALGPIQPLIEWVPGALSLWVKRLEREADHLPPSSAEVNLWSCTCTPPPHTSSRRGD